MKHLLLLVLGFILMLPLAQTAAAASPAPSRPTHSALSTLQKQSMNAKEKGSSEIKKQINKVKKVMRGGGSMGLLGIGLVLLVAGIIIALLFSGILSLVGSIITLLGLGALAYWLLIQLGVVG